MYVFAVILFIFGLGLENIYLMTKVCYYSFHSLANFLKDIRYFFYISFPFHLLIPPEVQPAQDKSLVMTIGDYVQLLLTELDYY